MIETEQLWRAQNRHPGDRAGLLGAAAELVQGHRVLYPGSYVDIAASFVFQDVTYVDTDVRANRFFADRMGVDRIIERSKWHRGPHAFVFVHADYATNLGLAEQSFDLVSLYAGFVSRACTRYPRPGGLLLANDSHGDASMASIDPDLALAAVIDKRRGHYVPTARALDAYLVPKRDQLVTAEWPYLFRRTAG